MSLWVNTTSKASLFSKKMLNIDNVDSWPFKLKQILTKLKIRQTNQIVIMVKSENLRNTAACAAVQNRGNERVDSVQGGRLKKSRLGRFPGRFVNYP